MIALGVLLLIAARAEAGLAYVNSAELATGGDIPPWATNNPRDSSDNSVTLNSFSIDNTKAPRDSTNWIYMKRAGGSNDALVDIVFDLGGLRPINLGDQVAGEGEMTIWVKSGNATRQNEAILSGVKVGGTTYWDSTGANAAGLIFSTSSSYTAQALSFAPLSFDTAGDGSGTKLTTTAGGFYEIDAFILTFRLEAAAGNATIDIDAISLTTPEPGSVALFALALLLLVGAVRRRRALIRRAGREGDGLLAV